MWCDVWMCLNHQNGYQWFFFYMCFLYISFYRLTLFISPNHFLYLTFKLQQPCPILFQLLKTKKKKKKIARIKTLSYKLKKKRNTHLWTCSFSSIAYALGKIIQIKGSCALYIKVMKAWLEKKTWGMIQATNYKIIISKTHDLIITWKISGWTGKMTIIIFAI